MSKMIKKALKLTGIAVTLSVVILAAIYLFETKTIAGSSEYKAVTENYVETENNAQTTENATVVASNDNNTEAAVKTNEVQTAVQKVTEAATTEAATTVEATQPVTETATTAATQPATEAVTTAATQPATEAATTAAATQPATEAAKPVETQAPVQKTPVYTNVKYSDGNNTYTFANTDEAKANLNIATLSTSEAKAAGLQNKAAYESMAKEVLDRINEYRASLGIAKVTYNETLTIAANERAAESAYANWNMTAYEGSSKRHIRPNYTKASTIMNEYGISGNFGENYGRYQSSAEEIVTGWKNSASHNALMTSSSYSKCGIGIAKDADGYYYFIALFN